jgi:fructose-bisphosphate aldolase class 1
MDESNPTCNKRFARLGIPQTEEARRAYRELIVTTPRLGECISGAILFDETIRQRKKDGTSFVKAIADAGIIPGIKVDTGAKAMAGHPGEKITEGLDGLRDRLAEYAHMGARFAKWRAVIVIGDRIPSRGCVEANAHALARYATLCQEAGLVPVVEPEVLMDGAHTLERCRAVTEEVLRTVFNQLYTQRVTLEGIILKPNMVLPGLTSPPARRGERSGHRRTAVSGEIDRPSARRGGSGGRSGRCHGEVPLANCPRRRSGDCIPVGRPIRRIGLGPFECHECSIQVAAALGCGVLVCPRHPATGFGDLARPGGSRISSAAGAVSSSHVQPGCAAW